MRIGVVAPSARIDEDLAAEVRALIGAVCRPGTIEIRFHPQCFLSSGHFAGSDEDRLAAFLEMANDSDLDGLWFARGGYGACRLTEHFPRGLGEAAQDKIFLGYSDAGFLLAGLYAHGIGRPVHAPMPNDLRRAGGKEALTRVLTYLSSGGREGAEPHTDGETKSLAFNLTVFSQLLGTPLAPDVTGHVLMFEDIGEYHYSLDRSLFHVTSNPNVRQAAGIRLGRCSEIPKNDRPFGQSVEEIFEHWCAVSGIPFLGTADIGHDGGNKIVPFGTASIFTRGHLSRETTPNAPVA